MPPVPSSVQAARRAYARFSTLVEWRDYCCSDMQLFRCCERAAAPYALRAQYANFGHEITEMGEPQSTQTHGSAKENAGPSFPYSGKSLPRTIEPVRVLQTLRNIGHAQHLKLPRWLEMKEGKHAH